MSTQRAADPNKEITKGDTWCTPVPSKCTRPDASTASLLLVTIRPCTNCNSGIATSQDCVGKTKRKPKSSCNAPTQHWHQPRLCRKTCNKKTMLQMHWHRCWRLQLESTLEISSLLANSAHPIISYHAYKVFLEYLRKCSIVINSRSTKTKRRRS